MPTPFGISPLCKGFEKVKFLLKVMQLTMVKKGSDPCLGRPTPGATVRGILASTAASLSVFRFLESLGLDTELFG